MDVISDNLGLPVFLDDNIIELIYNDNISACHDVRIFESHDVKKFNSFCNELDILPLNLYHPLDISQESFDSICQNQWFMPNKYNKIDIENLLLNKCTTEVEVNRVLFELTIYKKHNLYNLLRYLVYFVDVLRDNQILWGVGRGSSVASYVLFLIGIHRINSLNYNLDFTEFLK